jgi:hypothetical protein
MMAYLTYHCSAPSSLLFLPYCLSAHIICVVCSSAFYALCAILHSLHSSSSVLIQLLHSDSSSHKHLYKNHHLQQPPIATANSNSNNNQISSLYRVFIASVHFVHAMFSIPLHASTAPIFSTSRVLCEINILALQLLWLKPSVVSGSFTVACNSSLAINT